MGVTVGGPGGDGGGSGGGSDKKWWCGLSVAIMVEARSGGCGGSDR